MVELLLQAGADPSQVDNDGSSPLALATAKGHTEVVALLQARIDEMKRW